MKILGYQRGLHKRRGRKPKKIYEGKDIIELCLRRKYVVFREHPRTKIPIKSGYIKFSDGKLKIGCVIDE